MLLWVYIHTGQAWKTCLATVGFEPTTFGTVAKPARQFGHAMQILNHYHYSFLYKLIVFTVYEHGNICISWPNCRAGFAGIHLE
jgi:hypothetical protein